MQQQASAGDLVGAMQTFASIEQDYSTASAYPAAVSLALEALTRLQQDLAVRMEAVKTDQVQLKNTVDATAEPEKSNIIAEAKTEHEPRRRDHRGGCPGRRERRAPPIPRSQVSVETLQKTVASESSRLASIPVASMNLSISKVDAARTAITNDDYKTAGTLLADATSLWAQKRSRPLLGRPPQGANANAHTLSHGDSQAPPHRKADPSDGRRRHRGHSPPRMRISLFT